MMKDQCASRCLAVGLLALPFSAIAAEPVLEGPRATARCPAIVANGDNPFEPKFASTEYMQLTFPKGGEVFKTGDTITIKWKNCNHPKDTRLRISLNDERTHQGLEIAQRVPINKGSFRFSIPAAFSVGGTPSPMEGNKAYTISIFNGMYGGGSKDISYTAPFTINAGSGTR